MKKTILALFLLSGGALMAQEEELGTEMVKVVRAYNPEVSDANKIKQNPETELKQEKIQNIQYKTQSTNVVSDFKPAKISSINQDKQKAAPVLNNYVLFGYGNYKTPHLEFYMNNKTVKNQRYGVQLKHLSSEGGIEGVDFNNSFMNTSVNGFYWKQFKNYQLKSNLSYTFQKVNYYGVPDYLVNDDLLNSLNVGQFYNTIQADASFTNNAKKQKNIFNDADVVLYHFWDRFDSGESRVKLSSNFYIPVEGERIDLNASVDYISNNFEQSYYVNEKIENSFLNIGLAPSFLLRKDYLKLKLGLKLFYSADLKGDNSQFKIYPDIQASYNLVDDIMIAYAGLTGTLKQNSYKSIVEELPYVAPTIDIRPGSLQYMATVGLRGKLTSKLSYDASLNISKENDYLQFLQHAEKVDIGIWPPMPLTNPRPYEIANSFAVLRDTVNTVNVNASLKYEPIKDLLISAGADLNLFTSTEFDDVYNRANIKFDANIEYRFLEDFSVATSMYFVGKRSYAVYYAGPNFISTMNSNVISSGDLDPYFDLNFRVGYDVSEKLSIFTRFNNVLSNNYELYWNYPVQGFQAMAGLTYRF